MSSPLWGVPPRDLTAFFFVSQAHLRSEINYNWEKNMQDRPVLRKKVKTKVSRFLSWVGFRDEKQMEWMNKSAKVCISKFRGGSPLRNPWGKPLG